MEILYQKMRYLKKIFRIQTKSQHMNRYAGIKRIVTDSNNAKNEQNSDILCSTILDIVDLQPQDIAIDCGANVGNVTLQMALPGVEVHAFEPNPYAFAVLQDRFKNNPNVHCYQKGVYTKNASMKLYLHESAQQNQVLWSVGSSLLSYKGNVNVHDFVEVAVIDFAEFLRSMKRPVKLVKMDIEGVECDILNYLIDCGLISNVGVIVVETHERKVPELVERTAKLKQRVMELEIKNVRFDWT
jgi:FkbM family methyltransferase